MGEDICQAVLGILNSGIMPLSLNLKNIALIPKIKNPSSVCDFRLISRMCLIQQMGNWTLHKIRYPFAFDRYHVSLVYDFFYLSKKKKKKNRV